MSKTQRIVKEIRRKEKHYFILTITPPPHIVAWDPAARAPTPGIWLLGGFRVRECVLCTYSYAGGRQADWLAPLRVRAYQSWAVFKYVVFKYIYCIYTLYLNTFFNLYLITVFKYF